MTVDSTGLSPSFTVRVRDELALQFDARYARAAATLGRLRERVQAVVPLERRAGVMQHFAARDIEELAAMPPGAVEHEVERAVDTLAGVVPAQTKPLVCASRASLLAHDPDPDRRWRRWPGPASPRPCSRSPPAATRSRTARSPPSAATTCS